jgi:hypothetical protein
MSWGSDSSVLVRTSHAKQYDKSWYTYEANDTTTGKIVTKVQHVKRQRSIDGFEIRAITETYAKHWVDTHANDSGMTANARRANDADGWIVEAVTDKWSAWDTYTPT